LAVGFSITGHFRLRTAPGIPDGAALALSIGSGVIGVVSTLWLIYLYLFAYEYRRKYVYTNNDREPGDG
jgi:hypothetical protein